MSKRIVFFVFLLVSSIKIFGQYVHHYESLPKYIGRVNDFEHILTDNQIKNLTKIINDFEVKTTNEIAIVTVDSIRPYEDIVPYSVDLGTLWGIGKKGKNNGLLVVVSKGLRKIRISTGYGTEKILKDEICKKIIDTQMIPEFKNGDYYNGIKNGLLALIDKWQ